MQRNGAAPVLLLFLSEFFLWAEAGNRYTRRVRLITVA